MNLRKWQLIISSSVTWWLQLQLQYALWFLCLRRITNLLDSNMQLLISQASYHLSLSIISSRITLLSAVKASSTPGLPHLKDLFISQPEFRTQLAGNLFTCLHQVTVLIRYTDELCWVHNISCHSGLLAKRHTYQNLGWERGIQPKLRNFYIIKILHY